jgi:hypothetical protein
MGSLPHQVGSPSGGWWPAANVNTARRGRRWVALETVERAYVRPDGGLVAPPLPEHSSIVVQPQFSRAYELVLPKAEGLHSGGDRVMLEHLFRGGSNDDNGHVADERSGAWSALVGIAANASLTLGTPVLLADLAAGIPQPDMPQEPVGPTIAWQTFDPARYPFLAGARTAS